MSLWIDASAGASGDMLLGALLGAGVELDLLRAAVDAVSPEPVALRTESVRRAGLAATRCHVELTHPDTDPHPAHHRTWREVRRLLDAATLDPEVAELATRVFARLADAEGAVHGIDPDEVTFHEVGALDAIADVVGVSAGFLALARRTPGPVTVSPVAVGHGAVRGAHGVLPVPPPAVAELLRGVPSYAGPQGAPSMELCTPTGAALLVTLADAWAGQPAMTVDRIGVGAGTRDPVTHANVVRLLVGAQGGQPVAQTTQIVLEANVDDLDPRVWPAVLSALMGAGARDAWLTPIQMKKGRPAHTLHVLAEPDQAARLRREMFVQTSTIGVREHPVTKHPLARETARVDIDDHPVSVKLARLDGEVVSAQPEYDDVVAAANALGRPVVDVLAQATSLAQALAQHLR